MPAFATPAEKPPKVLLALEDGPVEDVAAAVPRAEMSEPSVPFPSKTRSYEGAANVAASLAALKGAVASQVKGTGQKALKKPASCLQAKVKEDRLEREKKSSYEVMKKPASKVSEKLRKAADGKAAAKKLPASSRVKKSTKKTDQKEKKAAKRMRLLATLPPKIRRKCKDGCGRCRWRKECTLSCWRLRGFLFE